jgi:hypothetical protein
MIGKLAVLRDLEALEKLTEKAGTVTDAGEVARTGETVTTGSDWVRSGERGAPAPRSPLS